MEVSLLEAEGLPEGCLLSIRAGTTRRQAPLEQNLRLAFPKGMEHAEPFKVDALAPLGGAALTLDVNNERYDVSFGNQMRVSISVRNTISTGHLSPAPASESPSLPGFPLAEKPDPSAANSNARRHRAALSARRYLDQHQLLQWAQVLFQDLIREQPENPWEYIDERSRRAQKDKKADIKEEKKNDTDSSVVTSKIVLKNLSLKALSAKPALFETFQGAVKSAIAEDLGLGLTTENITLSFASGSVIVLAAIDIGHTGPSGPALRARIGASRTVGGAVLKRVAALPGIQEASYGEITLGEVSLVAPETPKTAFEPEEPRQLTPKSTEAATESPTQGVPNGTSPDSARNDLEALRSRFKTALIDGSGDGSLDKALRRRSEVFQKPAGPAACEAEEPKSRPSSAQLRDRISGLLLSAADSGALSKVLSNVLSEREQPPAAVVAEREVPDQPHEERPRAVEAAPNPACGDEVPICKATAPPVQELAHGEEQPDSAREQARCVLARAAEDGALLSALAEQRQAPAGLEATALRYQAREALLRGADSGKLAQLLSRAGQAEMSRACTRDLAGATREEPAATSEEPAAVQGPAETGASDRLREELCKGLTEACGSGALQEALEAGAKKRTGAAGPSVKALRSKARLASYLDDNLQKTLCERLPGELLVEEGAAPPPQMKPQEPDVRAMRQQVRSMLEKAACDGRLGSALGQRAASTANQSRALAGTGPATGSRAPPVPEESGLEELRARTRQTLVEACHSGALKSQLQQQPKKDGAQQMREQLGGLLSRSAANGSLAVALEKWLWRVPSEADLSALRRQAKAALSRACLDGSLAAALRPQRPEPQEKLEAIQEGVPEDPAQQDEAPDLAVLRARARRALSSGNLAAVLARAPKGALARTPEDAMAAAQETLVQAVRDGSLGAELQQRGERKAEAVDVKALRQQARDAMVQQHASNSSSSQAPAKAAPPSIDIEALRLQAKDALSRAYRNGMPTAVPDDSEPLCAEARQALSQAYSDGQLADVSLREQARTTLVRSQRSGALAAALARPDRAPASPPQSQSSVLAAALSGPPPSGESAAELQESARDALLRACQDGKLAAACGRNESEELRREAREALLQASRDGSLALLSARKHSASGLRALRKEAREALARACQDGRLAAALAPCEVAAPPDLAALRRQARHTLVQALHDGKLTAALTPRSVTTDRAVEGKDSLARLREETRESFVKAYEDGSLASSLAKNVPARPTSSELEALRAQARHILTKASRTGSLSAALSTTASPSPTRAAMPSEQPDVESCRLWAQDLFAQALGDGSLDAALAQSVPEQDADADLRAQVLSVLTRGSQDGSLAAALSESFASPNAVEPEAVEVTPEVPTFDIADLRTSALQTLTRGTQDGSLAAALAAHYSAPSTQDAPAQQPPAAPGGFDIEGLRQQAKRTIAEASRSGLLVSALTKHTPLPVEEAAELEPAVGEEEALRSSVRDSLAKASADGSLATILQQRSRVPATDTEASSSLGAQKAAPDLDFLRSEMKRTLTQASRDGCLAAALRSTSPVSADEASDEAEERLRGAVRDSLAGACESGSLAQLLRRLKAKEEKDGGLELLRLQMKKTLSQASRDGSLVAAMASGPAAPPLPPPPCQERQAAAEQLRQESVLGGVECKAAAPRAKDWLSSATAAQLRSKALDSLVDAARQGSLAAALSQLKPSEPVEKVEDMRELRLLARKTLVSAADDGRLASVLGLEIPADAPCEEPSLLALRQGLVKTLVEASDSGALAAALGRSRGQPERAEAPQADGAPELLFLREEVRRSLTTASGNGSLESVLRSVRSGPEPEPREQVRKTLAEACADGSLAALLQKKRRPQPPAVGLGGARSADADAAAMAKLEAMGEAVKATLAKASCETPALSAYLDSVLTPTGTPKALDGSLDLSLSESKALERGDEVDDIREKAAEILKQASGDGRLVAELEKEATTPTPTRELQMKVESPMHLPSAANDEDPDLELLRILEQEFVSRKATEKINGPKEESSAQEPEAAEPENPQELASLKLKAQDALIKALERRLSARGTTPVVDPGEAARLKVRELLAQASADGSLSQVLQERPPALHEEVRATLVQAASNGSLVQALQSCRGPPALSEEEKLHAEVKETLSKASADGSLALALAKARPAPAAAPAAAPVKNLSLLRKEARATLVRSLKDGRLAAALTPRDAGGPPAPEKEAMGMQEQLKATLSRASGDGSLLQALQRCAGGKTAPVARSATAELREEARTVLTCANGDGSLAHARSKAAPVKRAAPDEGPEDLHKEARATLARANSSLMRTLRSRKIAQGKAAEPVPNLQEQVRAALTRANSDGSLARALESVAASTAVPATPPDQALRSQAKAALVGALDSGALAKELEPRGRVRPPPQTPRSQAKAALTSALHSGALARALEANSSEEPDGLQQVARDTLLGACLDGRLALAAHREPSPGAEARKLLLGAGEGALGAALHAARGAGDAVVEEAEKERPGSRRVKSVVANLCVENVDYHALAGRPELLLAFKETTCKAIALQSGVAPADVRLELSAGSVQIRATVLQRQEDANIFSKLQQSGGVMAKNVAEGIAQLDGIKDVSTGDISVKQLSLEEGEEVLEEAEEEAEEEADELEDLRLRAFNLLGQGSRSGQLASVLSGLEEEQRQLDSFGEGEACKAPVPQVGPDEWRVESQRSWELKGKACMLTTKVRGDGEAFIFEALQPNMTKVAINCSRAQFEEAQQEQQGLEGPAKAEAAIKQLFEEGLEEWPEASLALGEDVPRTPASRKATARLPPLDEVSDEVDDGGVAATKAVQEVPSLRALRKEAREALARACQEGRLAAALAPCAEAPGAVEEAIPPEEAKPDPLPERRRTPEEREPLEEPDPGSPAKSAPPPLQEAAAGAADAAAGLAPSERRLPEPQPVGEAPATPVAPEVIEDKGPAPESKASSSSAPLPEAKSEESKAAAPEAAELELRQEVRGLQAEVRQELQEVKEAVQEVRQAAQQTQREVAEMKEEAARRQDEEQSRRPPERQPGTPTRPVRLSKKQNTASCPDLHAEKAALPNLEAAAREAPAALGSPSEAGQTGTVSLASSSPLDGLKGLEEHIRKRNERFRRENDSLRHENLRLRKLRECGLAAAKLGAANEKMRGELRAQLAGAKGAA